MFFRFFIADFLSRMELYYRRAMVTKSIAYNIQAIFQKTEGACIMKTLTIAAFVALISATATAALSEQAPVTEKLAMGSYIVFAPSPQVWRVKVDPKTMNNATISGHFSV